MYAHLTDRRVLGALLVSVAMVLASLQLSQPTAAEARYELASAATRWADGLNHFVVPAAVSSEKVAPEARPALVSMSDDEARAKLPPGAVLSRSPAGEPMAIMSDGTIVSLASGRTANVSPEPQSTDGTDLAHMEAARIGAIAGVSAATPLPGGFVAVATRLDADELEAAGVEGAIADVLVQPNAVTAGTPDDPRFWQQWGFDNADKSGEIDGSAVRAAPDPNTVDADIDAPTAWTRSTGSGVVVAVLDTGVKADHVDLRDRMWTNSGEICGNAIDDEGNGYVDDCAGWDTASGDNDPSPDPLPVGATQSQTLFAHHGTVVAGTTAATADNGAGTVGVAPGATILPVKISDGDRIPLSAAIAGIYYAVDNGADVITAAFGLPVGTPSDALSLLRHAIAYANDRGVVIAAAVGNSGVDVDTHPVYPASFNDDFANLISTAATDNNDDLYSYSNYGETVDLAAPGHTVAPSADGSWVSMHGTSVSVGYVAGAAALLLATDPSLSAAQVKAALRDGSDRKLGLLGKVATGRLNAATVLGVSEDPFSVHYAGWENLLHEEQFVATGRARFDGATDFSGQNVELRATVVSPEQGELWGVADVRFAARVKSDETEAITDLDGGVVIDESLSDAQLHALDGDDGLSIRLTTSLPAGDYGLMLQLTDANGAAVSNGSAVYFRVSVPPTEEASDGTSLDSDSPDAAGGNGGSSSTTTNDGTSSDADAGDGDGAVGSSSGGHDDEGIANVPSAGVTTGPAGSTGTAASGNTGTSTSTTGAAGAATGSSGAASTPADSGTKAGSTSTTGGSTGSASSGTTTTTGSSNTESSGTEGRPVNVPSPALPVREKGWWIDSISPHWGPTAGGTVVNIVGHFPVHKRAYVQFDGIGGSITSATSTRIVVVTPRHAAGSVIVTVSGHGEVELNVGNGFTYVDGQGTKVTDGTSGSSTGGDSTTGSGSTSPAPGTSDSAGGSTTTGSNAASGDSGSTVKAPAAGDSVGDTQTATPGAKARRIIQRGSVRLVEPVAPTSFLSASNGAWAFKLCTTGSCPGSSVRI